MKDFRMLLSIEKEENIIRRGTAYSMPVVNAAVEHEHAAGLAANGRV